MTTPAANAVAAMPAGATATGIMSGVSGAMTGMGHRFSILIDNATYDFGTWHKATGLSVDWDKFEYRVGDSNEVWIVPGNPKYETIQLTRAACYESNIVQAWLVTTSRYPVPQSGTIMLVDWLGAPIVGWRLSEFFPIGWSITEFSADRGHVALETLKLAHTGFLLDELSLTAPAHLPA
jgi:phage tail-like protein